MADVEINKAGGTMFTGAGIDAFRMSSILIGLKAEIRGMRLTRGVNCFKIAKQEFGLKGNKESILAQFEKLVAEKKATLTVAQV